MRRERERERERRSVVVPEWAVVHSEVSCSDWLLVSLAALCDLNIFLQKSFRPSRAPGICSSLEEDGKEEETEERNRFRVEAAKQGIERSTTGEEFFKNGGR